MADPDDFSFDLDSALSRLDDGDDGSTGPASTGPASTGPASTGPASTGRDHGAGPPPPAPLRLDAAMPPPLRIEPSVVPDESAVDQAADPVPPVLPGSPITAPVMLVGAGASGEVPGRSPSTTTGGAPVAPNQVGDPRLPALPPPPVLAPPVSPGASAPAPSAAPPRPSRPLPRKVPRRGNVRRRRRGHGVRLFLIVLVLAGGVVAALTWGRGYLFPDEWDSVVIPLVEDVEATAGLTFDEPVAVRLLVPTTYGAAAGSVVLGDDWSALVPRWRALALASGEPGAFVDAAIAAAFPALYDPTRGEIIASEALRGRARRLALSEALTVALIDQHLGVNPDDRVALGTPDRARAARVLASFVTASSAETVPSRVPLAGLSGVPAPVAYEILAIDRLGASFAGSIGVVGGVDGALAGLTLDDLDSFAVASTPAPPGTRSPGEAVDGTVGALGSDAWHLVLASLLDGTLADDAATAIDADLLVPTTRGANACFTATFTAVSPDREALIGLALQAWADSMPVQASATATVVGDGTHQLTACDPGADATSSLRESAPAELVARQAVRFQR
jgi:hypothetical protein